ncbi:MAG: fasciclin domain-containing protein [Candidatus Obscuribacterales bacterium]|jgi:uncharacterized surface protein with fasciclin (FAS1) repeats
MDILNLKNIQILALVSLLSALPLTAPQAVQAKDNSNTVLIAANTEQFKMKQGFERKPKDIINTLSDNEVTAFHIFLDGLDQAFSLDSTLKNKGPFTVFAPSDKAFKTIPADDRDRLWANKKKLKEVLQYHIVAGKFDAKALGMMSSVKTLGGRELKLSKKGNDLYADEILIKTTDVPCSNGVIHVLDGVVMPQLSK